MSQGERPRTGRVRAARATDFDRVYPLLQQLNDSRISREVWQRLFQPLWRGEDYCPGYVLEDGEDIGGFIGTLYSERRVAGQTQRVCNLTSWVVLPAYRSQSVMLLMPILRDKSVTLTSLTSSVEAYAIYQKLGFKDLDDRARVVYRSLLPGRRGFDILLGDDCIAELDAAARDICTDHRGLDVQHCLVRRGGEQCYLMLERKRGRGHVHYTSDPAWFRDQLPRLRGPLLRRLDCRTLQVDERFLAGRRIGLSRAKVFDQPKQYRSRELDPLDIDALYSELAVLATPP